MKYKVVVKQHWLEVRFTPEFEIEAETEKEAIELAIQISQETDNWHESDTMENQMEVEEIEKQED